MSEPRRATDRPSNWNVPNALTVVRIILVPVYVVLLFAAPDDLGWRIAATAVFVVAMLTDLADGHIARSRNLITDFGKLWDPIADKALTGAAFVSLSILEAFPGQVGLPWFFTIIILVREWGITWVRAAIAKYGIMAANKGGKAKTLTQSLALILFSLGLQFLPGWIQVVAWILAWAALILTVVTGLDYLRHAWKIRADARAGRVG
ncbi:CDP-diacylglycerol--glycerol-3-phosphate 3-phosphatidyltransferase [Tessaracoccus lapidicaptus]|uniref:CDP-diacylglycerol--glycerol-3-phosphate 3-phosphatidyltransferase n=1 Tax=Tessaracoccus lapidicaptus TaxID=1427523 RepID=A0A1C0AMX5_9ACTN|nr:MULTISPECIES: CDP-diacylglycerol--glycerol-3-phosphate 3-phosphatidyltransferase [Tessaracoccus]AQX14829.1 CDP-diacylglycerol--glycerol-3-phosphate 3-phosphatidyltransferase [Tessaracoccus sp. T2.5-30]OCL34512.1 CDP-diacylglycerol--glycerol-3-phosphate 3-phosphatidyltransferase [Tessaracoccus lapidicaptus]VEP38942.1 Putative CDP-diacylglycerol--glycerol-3-phosphate 3-phosphatidyl-transferase 2 [Tessaracoccus lapidicaptus]